MNNFLIIAGICAAAIVFFGGIFIAKMYKRCSSDQVLVVFGSFLGGVPSKCYHGGGKIVLPLVQGYKYLSLQPTTISVDLKSVMSKNNIRVDVPSSVTFAIDTEKEKIQLAAQRILNLSEVELQEQAKEIIFGQLRAVVAQMTIEEINGDREKFLEEVVKNVETELSKLGLKIINFNIQDIKDESGYLIALGKKAASTAINQANVDVAQQEKTGQTGVAMAVREREISVAKEVSQQEIGKQEAARDQKLEIAKYEAEVVKGENEAKANIAQYNANLQKEEAKAKELGEVAKAKAEEAVLIAEKQRETARLEKEEVVQESIDRQKKEIKAAADAEVIRLQAKGDADAILAKAEAEAKGIALILKAKADGMTQIVQSVGGDPAKALQMMSLELMPSLLEKQIEGMKQVKIDKVVVIDQGGKDGGGVGGFAKDLMNSMPQVHEVANAVGLELPSLMGKMTTETPVQEEPKERKTE